MNEYINKGKETGKEDPLIAWLIVWRVTVDCFLEMLLEKERNVKGGKKGSV